MAYIWGYIKYGPETWLGTCKTGKSQSPIDVDTSSVHRTSYPPFNFDKGYEIPRTFFSVNNGHSVSSEFDTTDKSPPIVDGGGLDGKFICKGLHFHWKAEHTFDGKRDDLELHMVHYNKKYKDLGEALKHPDGVAVLAMLFNVKSKNEGPYKRFFDSVLNKDLINPHNGSEVKEDSQEKFSLKEFLPKELDRFYRYSGSLTTPGCQEVVQWTVFQDRFRAPQKVLDSFAKIKDYENDILTHNYRPAQPLNSREVFKSSSDLGSRLSRILQICLVSKCLLIFPRVM